jgi:PKD repeat protein
MGTAGDVNGDGYSDVIVGCKECENGEANEGRVFVYHGSATGLNPTPDWIAESNQVGARFGHSASTAGDVNGDGYSDVIIRLTPLGTIGKVFVYHGSAPGLNPTPWWKAESIHSDTPFGYPSRTAGDVNGDGYDDVIVGTLSEYAEESYEGRVFVYHGSVAGLEANDAPVADFSAASTNGEAPLIVNFTDQSIPNGEIDSWAWDFDANGTDDSNEQNPMYTFDSGGVYSVRLTVSHLGVMHTLVKTDYITVDEPPAAPVANFSATPTSGVRPLEVTFTDLSAPVGDVNSWAWDFDDDGTTDSILQNPVYTYNSAGIYTVKLTVTSPGGSDDETKIDYINVSEPQAPAVVIKDAYTCNDSGQPQTVFPPKEPIQFHIVYDVQGDPGTQYKVKAFIKVFGRTYEKAVLQYPGTDYVLIKDRGYGKRIKVPGTAAGKTKTVVYKLKLKLSGELLDKVVTTSQITVTGP